MTRKAISPAVAEGQAETRPPVLSFIGPSGSGKTTMLERLVPILKELGHRVAIIKHVHHKGFELDTPGKDSYRLTQAGADIVLLSSPERIALLEETPREWDLPQLLTLVHNRADLVLTEGYRGRDAPQIAVGGLPPDVEDPLAAGIVAIISDAPLSSPLPRFGFGEAEALARWLGRFCDLTANDDRAQ